MFHSENGFATRLFKQLDAMWGLDESEMQVLNSHIDSVLASVVSCLESYKTVRLFSFLNTSHWCIFLQFFRQAIGPCELSDKLYNLSKMLHSVDFYSAKFPANIYLEHPLGTVVGRAVLGNRLCLYQGVTIGGSRNENGELSYPEIGNDVTFYAGSAVIGRCKVGDNVIFSAGARVINCDVPDNSIVFGTPRNNFFKPLSQRRAKMLSVFSA